MKVLSTATTGRSGCSRAAAEAAAMSVMTSVGLAGDSMSTSRRLPADAMAFAMAGPSPAATGIPFMPMGSSSWWMRCWVPP